MTDGTPRDDCLFDPDPARVAEVRGKLGLEEGVKVLMYAPTFRDTATVEGQVGSDIDLNDVLRVLGEKTGEKWVCLMRAHGGRALTLTSAAETSGFVDVTRYPDMADLLLVTDMLITDYSSAGGDFAITGRPVLLYQDDIENYTNKDRSMYFKMEDSPYWVAHNREEAVELINGITPEAARENDEAILKFYETTETGHATESVCRRIMDFWG